MAIPAPWPEAERRRDAFVRMRTLFQSLAAQHAQVDTLSMGMSSDYADAIAEGATWCASAPPCSARVRASA
jgi:uncharacterized pyridoxal phosphate-containing UPF0001 family protein